MAKASATIREAWCYQPHYAYYFAEHAVLFNRVVAFSFSCIQAHEGILSHNNQQALSALEKLTHATEANPNPVMPLRDLAPDIPAMFRRAAINAALGSLCPRIFLLPQKVAATQGEVRSSASAQGEEEAIS